jgi:MOSC domain-containing protein YiiM
LAIARLPKLASKPIFFMAGEIISVNVGCVGAVKIPGSASEPVIFRQPVACEVRVESFGLQGNEHANKEIYGGLAKAVYAYPHEHYGFWQTVRAQARVSLWNELLPFGSMGEDLTIRGLLETQVWVGDVLRFPGCALAVSEPRLPCSKVNAALGFAHAAKLMAQSRWCGFYLAVREPGVLVAGQAFELIPGPREVNIKELFESRMIQ